jgi:hypothetical protein
MKCPAPEELLRSELGELVTHRANDIARHVATCAACIQRQRAQRALFEELAAPPALPLSDGAFVEGVLRRRDLTDRTATGSPRNSLPWAVGLAAVVAMAAAWAIVPRLGQHEGTFTARGAKHETSEVAFVEVLRVRANGLEPIRGTTLHPGDGINVRYTNPSKLPRYLMVFVLDSQREVHWIYPAYLDPGSNPDAVELAPQTTARLLDEAVEPEAPAPGPLRIVTLVMDRPLTVKDVEARIRSEAPDLKRLFPAVQVNDWGCTWLAK